MKGLDLYHQKKVWFLQIRGVKVEITNKKARFSGFLRLMTFGAKAEVLEPAEARDIIHRNAEETLKIYGGLA